MFKIKKEINQDIRNMKDEILVSAYDVFNLRKNKNENKNPILTIKSINQILSSDTIDTSKIEDMVQAIFALGMNRGSLVGATTVGIQKSLSALYDVEQFKIKDKTNGKVISGAKAKKVYKNLGKDIGKADDDGNVIEGEQYNDSLFSVEKGNIVFTFNKNNHRLNQFFSVSADTVKEFDERLRRINPNTLTEDQLILMSLDMDIVGRAMLELSIDSTKDESKTINTNIHSIIDGKTKTTAAFYSDPDNFQDNIKIVMDNAVNGDVNTEIVIADDSNVVRLSDINTEEQIKNGELDNALLEVTGGLMGKTILDASTDYMNQLRGLLKYAKESIHTDFVQKFIISVNESLTVEEVENLKNQFSEEEYAGAMENAMLVEDCKLIVKACRNAMYAMTTIYGRKQDPTNDIKGRAEDMKEALLCAGEEKGFDNNKVLEFAIIAAFTFENEKGKLVYNKRPMMNQLWDLFPKAYVDYFAKLCGAPIRTELTPIVCPDLREGSFYMDDSFCTIGDEILMVHEKYTGAFHVESDGTLVADYDVFERADNVDYLILESIYVKNEIDSAVDGEDSFANPAALEHLSYTTDLVEKAEFEEQAYKIEQAMKKDAKFSLVVNEKTGKPSLAVKATDNQGVRRNMIVGDLLPLGGCRPDAKLLDAIITPSCGILIFEK